MAGIYLPRERRNRRVKKRQPLHVESVPQTNIDRQSNDRFEQVAVKERQLKFKPVEIYILKMASEFSMLVVEQQEEVKITCRIW